MVLVEDSGFFSEFEIASCYSYLFINRSELEFFSVSALL